MRIEIMAGRGKNYVAQITGRDPKYRYARRFLGLVETGYRMNCYKGMQTTEDVPVGAIVEVATSSYKGSLTREFQVVTDDGSETISEARMNDLLGDTK
jgi:hypothetical protein